MPPSALEGFEKVWLNVNKLTGPSLSAHVPVDMIGKLKSQIMEFRPTCRNIRLERKSLNNVKILCLLVKLRLFIYGFVNLVLCKQNLIIR